MRVDINQHSKHPHLTPSGVEVVPLPVDYQVGDLLIEHKTARDFMNSIISARLWQQAKDAQVFLVEWNSAELLKHCQHFQYSSYIGALASLIYSFKSSVLLLPSEWMRDFIKKLAEKEDKQGQKPSPRKGRTIEEVADNILLQFPGISWKRLAVIKSSFSSLRDVFASDEERIMNLKLPDTVKGKMMEVINYKW